MVHPKVLEACNIDPNEYSWFTFGMWIDKNTLHQAQEYFIKIN